MTSTDAATLAARNAEQDLWRQYNLTVAERLISVSEPRLRVRFLECGNPSAPPLLFIPGGIGEAWVWASLMAGLSDYRCITLDRPGGGMSDGVDFRTVDVGRLAADVLQATMDAVGVKQAAFVANSMGGWWTFQLAMRAPERIAEVVMIGCPASLLDTVPPLPMRLMSLPVIGPVLVKLMKPKSRAKARELPRFLGHPAQVGEQWSDVQAETAYRFGNLPNVERSWFTLLRRFLRLRESNPAMRINAADLRSIAHSTLFVWGTDDPFGSIQQGIAAAKLMSVARLEIAGHGHLPWWDEPDLCARLVRGFLQHPHVDKEPDKVAALPIG
jgi:pimeloyl-ACP methyl ester carboxylesterase